MKTWKKVRENMMQDENFADYCKDMQVAADVAHAIMDIRLYNGWTQQELAKRSGVSQADISRYENMDKLPTVATLKKLAKAGGYIVRISLEQIDKEEVKTPKGVF